MKLLVSLFLVISLSACATNEQTGAGTGAVLGGVLGNSVGHGSGRAAATVIGAFAGAIIGGSIGRHMDRSDHDRSRHVLETNQTGQASSWRNPDTGNAYVVTPTRTYQVQGQPCREFTTTAIIGGRQEQIYGTACRQADGSWKTQ